MSVNDAKQPLQDLIVYTDIRNSVGNNLRWNVPIALENVSLGDARD